MGLETTVGNRVFSIFPFGSLHPRRGILTFQKVDTDSASPSHQGSGFWDREGETGRETYPTSSDGGKATSQVAVRVAWCRGKLLLPLRWP